MVSFKTLLANEDAQSIVEYALLAGLIALVAVAAVTVLGEGTKTIFNNIAAPLSK
jgi:pilus assembly protein Flp/PilA